MKITRPNPKHYEIVMDDIRDDGTRGHWRVGVRFDEHFMPWFGIVVEPTPGSTSKNPEGYGGHVRAGECLAIAGLLMAALVDHVRDEVSALPEVQGARALVNVWARVLTLSRREVRNAVECLPVVQRVRARIWAHLHVRDIQAAVQAANARIDRAEAATAELARQTLEIHRIDHGRIMEWRVMAKQFLRLHGRADMKDATLQAMLAEQVEQLAKVFGMSSHAGPVALVDIVRVAETAPDPRSDCGPVEALALVNKTHADVVNDAPLPGPALLGLLRELQRLLAAPSAPKAETPDDARAGLDYTAPPCASVETIASARRAVKGSS